VILTLIAAAATSPQSLSLLQRLEQYGTLILGAGVLALVGTIITVQATKQKTKNEYVQGQFTSAKALDEYIDGRIERVAKPLRDELKKLQDRELSSKIILYGFFQRLMWWDETGRLGVMPLPDADDLTKLGVDLADLSTTQEKDTVRAAVTRMRERQHTSDNITDIHPQQNGTSP